MTSAQHEKRVQCFRRGSWPLFLYWESGSRLAAGSVGSNTISYPGAFTSLYFNPSRLRAQDQEKYTAFVHQPLLSFQMQTRSIFAVRPRPWRLCCISGRRLRMCQILNSQSELLYEPPMSKSLGSFRATVTCRRVPDSSDDRIHFHCCYSAPWAHPSALPPSRLNSARGLSTSFTNVRFFIVQALFFLCHVNLLL